MIIDHKVKALRSNAKPFYLLLNQKFFFTEENTNI